ncbi:MAG: DUF3575 domain-containing protein [Flammeovirgaceae bacterium]
MRYSLLFTIAFFSCFWLNAQDHIVKLNITSPLVSTITVAYSHPILDEKTSVQGTVSITYGYETEGQNITGWAIGADYRKYLWMIGKQNGIYCSPFLRYQRLTLQQITGTIQRNASILTAGAVLGRQWVFSNRFVLDGFIGPSLNTASLKPSAESLKMERLRGLRIRAGFAVGLLF